MSVKDKYQVKSIDAYLTHDWLLHKHYAKRIPSISYSFGLYNLENILNGVLTIGKPPSPSLCIGVCGEEYSKYVYELNRLCINDNLEKNVLSYFVSSSLKLLKDNLILVSYADTSQNHHGYIYQATNWLYTGLSDKRKGELYDINNPNRHSKAVVVSNVITEIGIRERPQKHRYIYFIGKKSKTFKDNLKYKIQPYPKGENKRYDASYNPTIQTQLF